MVLEPCINNIYSHFTDSIEFCVVAYLWYWTPTPHSILLFSPTVKILLVVLLKLLHQFSNKYFSVYKAVLKYHNSIFMVSVMWVSKNLLLLHYKVLNSSSVGRIGVDYWSIPLRPSPKEAKKVSPSMPMLGATIDLWNPSFSSSSKSFLKI